MYNNNNNNNNKNNNKDNKIHWHRGMVGSLSEWLEEVSKHFQTVLSQIEHIINNRPRTYAYPDDTEECLTPNHLLFGRRHHLAVL